MTLRDVLMDEGADRRLVPWLRAQGCNVTVVSQDYPSGIADREIIRISERERRVIITRDTDFGELIVREGLPHAGVILLRLRSHSLATAASRLEHVFATYADELHRYLIVTDDGVRIR